MSPAGRATGRRPIDGGLVALWASLVVACAPPRATPVVPSASSGNDNVHALPAVTDAPGPTLPGPTPDEALAGRWSITHGGSPWIELEVAVHPGLSARVLSFDPTGSWTEFAVVRVKLGDDGSLELTGQYSEFEDVVDIVLYVRGSVLEGTASGRTYGSPEPLLGRRLP